MKGRMERRRGGGKEGRRERVSVRCNKNSYNTLYTYPYHN